MKSRKTKLINIKTCNESGYFLKLKTGKVLKWKSKWLTTCVKRIKDTSYQIIQTEISRNAISYSEDQQKQQYKAVRMPPHCCWAGKYLAIWRTMMSFGRVEDKHRPQKRHHPETSSFSHKSGQRILVCINQWHLAFMRPYVQLPQSFIQWCYLKQK